MGLGDQRHPPNPVKEIRYPFCRRLGGH